MNEPEIFHSEIDRALVLGGLPGFSDLDADQLAAIAAIARERSVARGERLARLGEVVPAAWVVVEGGLDVQGPSTGAMSLGPRQGVGLLLMLARAASGLDIVASTDTHVLEFDHDTVRDAFEEDFSLYVHWTRDIAARTLEIRRRIQSGTLLAPVPEILEADLGSGLFRRLQLVIRRGNFRAASLDAIAEFSSQMQDVHYDAGARLWRRDESSGFACFLLSGVVRCELSDERGWFRAGPVYPLGNLESLAGQPRWFDAIAETPIHGLRMETELLLDVLEDHFGMAMELLEANASHLIHLMEDEHRG